MIVRSARPADRVAIRALVDAAFAQPAEGLLVEALVASGDAAVELVAEDGGAIVGHVLLSRLEAPAGALALAPLAVAPRTQGRGVGAALVRRALDEARRAGAAAIFVLGDPAYYDRFGFSRDAAARFRSPYPADHMTALALFDGAFAALSPSLVYPAPFRDLEEDP